MSPARIFHLFGRHTPDPATKAAVNGRLQARCKVCGAILWVPYPGDQERPV